MTSTGSKNAGTPDPKAGGLLKDGDLIDDRELRRADQDRFEHARIADELVELAVRVEAPSNVALYGAWGSGKTGIANLMRSKVATRHKGVKFARFDAFKYAENPLRRKFVTAIATELGIKDPRYHDDLYSGRTRSDVHIPTANLFKVAGIFAGLLVAIALLTAAIVAVVAWAQSGEFDQNFKSISNSVATAGLLPAALLAALAAMVGKSLQIDRSLAKPDSDEQFETLLADLVSASKATRVIISVDELDRCAAKDVVATLDAVRTFLGVPKCIFVVAADQQVLEQALCDQSAQATPADTRNPYYSTGSAYLDKVFQYQVALPDLLPPNVTEFAVNLVNRRTGCLWSELPRRDFVVSILVPGHVTSPRRVKHLLNTFALTYRLAEDRHRAGTLDARPTDIAAALAKLVCLRVEFPMFARDLATEERLPALVLDRMDNRLSDALDDDVNELVERHVDAVGGAQVSLLVSDSEDDSDVEEVRRRQHRQFINYLRRTAGVSGLTRDLIYLKSEASFSGLPSSVARTLTSLAEDADAAEVEELFTEGVIPAGNVGQAIAFLVSRVHHTYGVESENITKTLMVLAAGDLAAAVEVHADEILSAAAGMAANDTDIFTQDTLPGAWRLALVADYDTADIKSQIIDGAVATKSNPTTLQILRSPVAAGVNKAGMTHLLTEMLLSDDWADVLDILDAMDSPDRVAALELCEDVAADIAYALKAHEEYRERAEAAANPTAAATATVTAAAATATDEDDTEEVEPLDARAVVQAIAKLASSWAETDLDAAYAVLKFLLRINHADARSAVEAVLETFAPTSEPQVIKAIASATMVRALESWPSWLGRVRLEAHPDVPNSTWQALGRRLWKLTKIPTPRTESIEGAASALASVLEHQTFALDLTREAVTEVQSVVITEKAAMARRLLLGNLTPLERHGFIDGIELATATLTSVARTLGKELVPDEVSAPVVDYVAEVGPAALASVVAAPNATESARDAVVKLLDALGSDESWIPEPARTTALLAALSAQARQSKLDASRVPGAGAVGELLDSWESKAVPLLSTWLDLGPVGVADFEVLLAKVLGLALLDGALAEGFAVAGAGWTDDERITVLSAHLGAASARTPKQNLLKAVGLTSAPPTGVAELLGSRFKASSNNAQRVAVLDIWVAACIEDETARSRLFDTVATPMVKLKQAGGKKSNAEAVRAVLTHMSDLGAPPKSSKRQFDRALADAIEGDAKLESLAVRVMGPLGYQVKREGLVMKHDVLVLR